MEHAIDKGKKGKRCEFKLLKRTKAIIKTANQKLSVLIRVSQFLIGFNRNVLFYFFIKRQFNYYPLLCIFSTRAAKHEIKRFYERRLIALVNVETSAFIEVLSKSSDTTIHIKFF